MRGLSHQLATERLSREMIDPAILHEPSRNNWMSTDWDFSHDFSRLENIYKRRKRPIAVNFRSLVKVHSGVDRATHLLHSYPAKLLANIPIFFLHCDQLRVPGGLVIDPFCGTGTVLLEAILSGHRTLGADSNPLARLIAETKLTPIPAPIVEGALKELLIRSRRIKPAQFAPVVDVSRWFSPRIRGDLGRLLASIRCINEPELRRFMEVCFSNCIRKVSLADPRMSVPVRARTRGRHTPKLAELFSRCVLVNSRRLQSLLELDPELLKQITIVHDARQLSSAAKCLEASLIITSPPYLGAQKYIRASSLSIGWLGLAPSSKLRNLERQSIGREHFCKNEFETFKNPAVGGTDAILRRLWKRYPLRAHIAATYLAEMKDALLESCRHLRQGGHFILIIGNNSVCGLPFSTARFLKNILNAAGLTLRLELIDEIRSRGLMTKRNKTAGLISREHILVLRKS
jgi:hypothetical protein